MNEPQMQSVEFDVNLPKPGPRNILSKVLIGVGALLVVGVVAALVVSRTAAPELDATLKVMPANTMLVMGLNTHTDQLPNFNVIADAWKDSKEANQVKSALQIAFMQTGFSWEDDVAPWLGDRAAFGLVDMGDFLSGAALSTDSPAMPFYLLAVSTRDRAKSDAFLAAVRKELESNLTTSEYMTQTLRDDVYRGVPLVNLSMETAYGEQPRTTDVLAYATVNDVIVVSIGSDNLKKAIDAALDGNNLSLNDDYKTTMNALPQENAFALYMDFGRFMSMYTNMMLGVSSQLGDTFDSIYESMDAAATPTPEELARREEAKRQREAQEKAQLAQIQQMTDLMQAYGGMGMVMTYEPTGVRFDISEQFDPAKLPEQWKALMTTAWTTAITGQSLDALPPSALMVLNGAASTFAMVLDPGYLSMAFAGNPMLDGMDFASQLSEFEARTGLNLKADVVDLIGGEYALGLWLKDAALTGDSPLDVALLIDSPDAARLSASVDKLFQAMAKDGNDVEWQSLSGLPYSVVSAGDDKPLFTYGVVDGRFVIGSTSETLLAVDNAPGASLATDPQFKTAVSGLPAKRTQTFYFQFAPLWKLLDSIGNTGPTESAVLNYLRPFQYITIASEAPGSDNVVRGVMHIGIGK